MNTAPNNVNFVPSSADDVVERTQTPQNTTRRTIHHTIKTWKRILDLCSIVLLHLTRDRPRLL